MKKEKAFTLIELLAVIVILAIIAVIATPIAINVINDARKRSFINSVYGLIDGARLLSAEQLFDAGTNEVVVQFQDGTADNTNFKVSGDIPASGTIHLNSEGKIELKVWSEELGKCAEKSATESEVNFTDTPKEDCKLEVTTLTSQTFTEVLEKAIETGQVRRDNTEDQNLRYIGQNPNNYVSFNKDAEGNPEKWRIIGVFDGQAKIIRNDYYTTSIEWDSDNINNWESASLQLDFNNTNNGYITTIQVNDSTSYGYIDLEHEWGIGTASTNNITRSEFYNTERSKNIVGENNSEKIWIGTIGLMYPSDYGYSTSATATECDTATMYDWRNYEICYTNSWLYDDSKWQWTITSNSSNARSVYGLGNNIEADHAGSSNTARPTLYLKENVKIIDGLGTDQQPYILGIE